MRLVAVVGLRILISLTKLLRIFLEMLVLLFRTGIEFQACILLNEIVKKVLLGEAGIMD